MYDFKIKSAILEIMYFSKKELSDNLTCIHNIWYHSLTIADLKLFFFFFHYCISKNGIRHITQNKTFTRWKLLYKWGKQHFFSLIKTHLHQNGHLTSAKPCTLQYKNERAILWNHLILINNQIAIVTNTLTNQLNYDTQITGIQVNISHTLNGKSIKSNFEFWIHRPAGKNKFY